VKKALLKTILFKGLQLGTSMAMLWFTAAWMGPVLRGQTSLVLALVHGGVLISGFGAGSGMIYYASRIRSDLLWRWSQLWALLAALGTGLLSGACMEWPLWISMMVGILTWFHSTVASGRGYLLGRGFLHKDNVAGWMIPLLPVLMLGGSYGVQQAGGRFLPTLDLFVGIQLAAMGIMAGWAWMEIMGHGKSNRGNQESPAVQGSGISGTDQDLFKVGKAMWSFNRWTASANLGQFVVYRFQYIIMITMLGPAELGIYSVAVAVAEGAWVITQSYSTVLLSSLSSHQGPAGVDLLRRSWRWSMQALVWTVLPMGVLVCLPVSWLNGVLGPSYEPVHGLWIALAPGVLALAFSNVLVQHFTALGKVKVSFVSSWGTALLMVAGLGEAMQMAGAEGVAWWTSAVLVLNALGVLAYFRKSGLAYL